MATRAKAISGMDAISTFDIANDLMEVVDVSDTTDAASGTNKKVTIGDLAESIGIVNVKNRGAIGDGVTDDTAAFTSFYAALSAGGIGLIPPGSYLLSSQTTLAAPTNDRVVIFGWGAEIVTSGAISGLKVTGGSSNGGVHIHGLQINQRGDANATYGFDLVGATNCRLYDCYVEAHGNQANYACYHLSNTTPADVATGCFWTYLIGCGQGKRSGSDVGDIPYGILIEGSANAVNIIGGQYGRETTTCLKVKTHSGQTYLANGLLVQGAAFETYTTAIEVEGAATSNLAGHRFIGNRFESGTTVFSFTGTTTQPSVPPYMSGNYLVSDAGTYLNNPNALYINSLDLSVTPTLSNTRLTNNDKVVLACLDGTKQVLELVQNGTGQNLHLALLDGTSVFKIRYASSGHLNLETNGTTIFQYLIGLGGISGTATTAQNLRGSGTFNTAATLAVAFSTNEADGNYQVFIGAQANETFWVTSKANTGFTINSSNASSTANVSWLLVR